MKTIKFALTAILFTTILAFAGCDYLDPTGVENPSTTDEDLAQAPAPTGALVPGLRGQFARALGAVVVATEFASDNFSINGTGLGGSELDFSDQLEPTVPAIAGTGGIGAYWNLQELRALADFVLEEIAPEDATATDELLGEAHYFRGMAYLLQGENFVAVPAEADGAPVKAGDLLSLAATEFQSALGRGVAGDILVATKAGLARAHRALGNGSEMARFANEALSDGGADFAVVNDYDATPGSIGNVPQDFLVDRALQEMQPLPRLDFLDPKYVADESAIPVATAEDMLLMLAEFDMAQGLFDEARTRMIEVITLAESRSRVDFEDTDQRLDNELNVRPRTSTIEIQLEAAGPFVAGLVLDRPGAVSVPAISATHVTADQVTATAEGEDLIRLLYLIRQEVLFLEGRRMHDLGMRFPMMLREIEQNAAINEGDVGTVATIPAYIPARNEMDLYTPLVIYDSGEPTAALVQSQITMMHDMNRILAASRGLVSVEPLLP